jgi:hypothetical protein
MEVPFKQSSGNHSTYTGHTHHAGAKDSQMRMKQDKSATTPSKNYFSCLESDAFSSSMHPAENKLFLSGEPTSDQRN